MKFEINGKRYDPIEGVRGVSLQTLYELKVRHGVGVKDLQQNARKMEKVKDAAEIFEDAEAFKTFMVIIWLARKHAGETMTLEEANSDFGMKDLLVVREEGDAPLSEEPAIDPKAQAASARAGGRRRKKRKRS